MIRVGLIGFGYWGPNLARNLNANGRFRLAAVCDRAESRLKRAAALYPQTLLTADPEEFFQQELDAVAVATPVSTHYELAARALESGRHVWIEKPMTETVEEAERLIELAEKKSRVLLVDHTFVYTGAVRKMKEMINQRQLGDLIYYDSTRVNLGLFQQDVNVLWDLAPHDLSIMDHLMPFPKLAVSATGCHYYGNGIVPKSLLTIYMEGHVVGHVNVSWVSPVKIRRTLIGGTSRMILYDDTEPSEKVKVYDKGVDVNVSREELYHLKVQYRVGDMYAPRLDDREALAVEAESFADCIEGKARPVTGGRAGLEVVKVLVAAEKSLRLKGAPVEL